MGFALLRKVDIRPPGNLRCQFSVVDRQDDSKVPVLTIEFSGDYPEGSQGNKHGEYIAAMGLLGASIFDPWAIILDFRNLNYRWGNTLLKVFQDLSRFMDAENQPGEPEFPVIVVTSEKSRGGILSLLTPNGAMEPSWHFNNIEAAIKAAFEAAQQWIDA